MRDKKAFVFPNDAALFPRPKKPSAEQTTDGQKPAAILQRIAAGEMTAVRQCLDAHGSLVWALARNFTSSIEEAETATEKIFLDIWKHADRFDAAKVSEDKFIFLLACRCLIKRNLKSAEASDGGKLV